MFLWNPTHGCVYYVANERNCPFETSVPADTQKAFKSGVARELVPRDRDVNKMQPRYVGRGRHTTFQSA